MCAVATVEPASLLASSGDNNLSVVLLLTLGWLVLGPLLCYLKKVANRRPYEASTCPNVNNKDLNQN